MKIQSVLVLAMVGSAAAANKRKRVFKIYSHEDVDSIAATRSLQEQPGGAGGNVQPDKNPAAPLASMSMASSMSMANQGEPGQPGANVQPDENPEPAEPVASMSMAIQGGNAGGNVQPDKNPEPAEPVASMSMAIQEEPGQPGGNAQPDKNPEPAEPLESMSMMSSMSMAIQGGAGGNGKPDKNPEPTSSTEMMEPPSPTPPTATFGAPSGAMTMETTLAAFAVAGAVMLV